MTEYTTDPEAVAHFLAARARTANWVDSLSGKTLVAPSVPPSLVSDTDDGLSSPDSDAESSHSLPPRMILKYPDGRPDVTVSGSGDSQWPPQSHKPTSGPYHTRPPPGFHGYPPSNPNIHSRTSSNAVPLYVAPPAPVVTTQPETIHVRPSPTSLGPQQSPNAYSTPDSHNSPSMPPRSRSMRSTLSSRPPPSSLQIYASPPAPSSQQSHSAPVSPTRESFQSAQQPPPVPQLPIIAPSPVYGFPSPSSPHDLPPLGPSTHSKTHSRTHSHSSNHSYPHPPIPQSHNPGPPSSFPSGSAQRLRRHSSRAGASHPDPSQPHHTESQSGSHRGSTASGSRRHAPPSIVYAPSTHSSSYTYNPPVITTRPPHPPTTIHAPTPHHAHAHRMAQSISDPTPIGGSLGRNSNRGRLFEDFSRTPSPTTARARARESSKKDKLRKDRSRRREGNGGRDDDDAASFSSGSTYYVLPSPGQKIKVVVCIRMLSWLW
jgi:hypothetical protein